MIERIPTASGREAVERASARYGGNVMATAEAVDKAFGGAATAVAAFHGGNAELLEVLAGCFSCDPKERITAKDALKLEYLLRHVGVVWPLRCGRWTRTAHADRAGTRLPTDPALPRKSV